MGKRHHKYDYFSAFESLSELAVDEADLLIKAIEEFSTADALKETMEKAHAIEHKGDDINHDIFRNVATDVSSDITVLRTVLAQEGLTESPFDKAR